MKYYLISIAIYFIGIILLGIRYKANENEMKSSKSKEGKLYTYTRFIVIAFIPLVNAFAGVVWMWWSLLTTQEDFIEKMNE